MAKRIMVVDDSRITALQIEQLLDGTGYEVAVYCQNGEAALEQYDQFQPDLVTMDIIMPGMDGLETTEALLEEHPDAKVLMLSSLAYEDTFEEARALGALGFIEKPIDRENLLDNLDRALGGAV